MCKFFARGRCGRGEQCSFAHRSEDLRRVDLARTQVCVDFMRSGACRAGSDCRFAHGYEELRSRTDAAAPPPGGDAPEAVVTLRAQIELLSQHINGLGATTGLRQWPAAPGGDASSNFKGAVSCGASPPFLLFVPLDRRAEAWATAAQDDGARSWSVCHDEASGQDVGDDFCDATRVSCSDSKAGRGTSSCGTTWLGSPSEKADPPAEAWAAAAQDAGEQSASMEVGDALRDAGLRLVVRRSFLEVVEAGDADEGARRRTRSCPAA